MKLSCLGTLLLICISGLINLSSQTSPTVDLCSGSLGSRLHIGDTATVQNIPEGHYLPLYAEPISGGTNGGLTNGSTVSIVDGPTCNNATWWKVTGQDPNGEKISGYAQETTNDSRFLVPLAGN